ncbi:MAG: hypothetical protein HFG71_01655 [Hungatella sp.]|nr:hypothetical protein [Hungatella sp.]
MRKKTINNTIILVILFFGIEFLFFKKQILNGTLLEALYGDKGDARFCCLILEHYFEFIKGNEKFADLKIFYPIVNTISYSDMLLGYTIPYCLFRILGINMYSSFNLSVLFYHMIGTISMIYLLKRKLRMSFVATAMGAFSFSCAASYTSILGHVQFGFIGILPVIMIFLLNFFENILTEKKEKRICNGYLAIVGMMLLLYSSFYLAYFFVFFLAIAAIVLLGIYKEKKKLMLQLKLYICNNKVEILSYILIITLLSIPFFRIYLPTLEEMGGYSFEHVLNYTPHLYDVFSVSKSNLLMGDLMNEIGIFKENGSELVYGFPIITIMLFLYGMVMLIADDRHHEYELFFKTISISTIILYLLFIQISGHVIWKLFYSFLPGASAIRAVGRIFFFMIFPVSLIVSYASEYLLKKKKYRKIWGSLFIFLIIISNYDKNGVSTHWSTKESLDFEMGIKEPPSDCEAMFIIYEGDETNPTNVQTLSWSIAEKFDLKCLNGYSGNFPPDWQGIYNVFDKDTYLNGIRDWILRYKIDNVYAYDLSENEWIRWN